MPCCAVLRAVLYLLFRSCHVSFDEVSSSSTDVHHTRFVRTQLLNFCEMLSVHLSSALAQQRSAQRRVVACFALPCGGELRYTVLCFHSNTRHQVSPEVPGTRYRYVCVYSSFSFLRLLSSPSTHLAFFFSSFPHITPALLITQHSTWQSPPNKYILALSNRSVVATKPWASCCAPFTYG